MLRFSAMALALIALVGFALPAAAAPASMPGAANAAEGRFQHPQSGLLLQVQSRAQLCQNWRRECRRLWGYRTYEYRACMNQPTARYDCAGRRGWKRRYRDVRRGYWRRPARGGSCRTWKRACTRSYGRNTKQWYDCMGQRGAIRACSGRRY